MHTNIRHTYKSEIGNLHKSISYVCPFIDLGIHLYENLIFLHAAQDYFNVGR